MNEGDSEKNPLRYWLAGVIGCAIFAFVQFLVSTIICIANYPPNRDPEGYFLSDLGRSALRWSWLFNGSLIVLGLLLIPMFIMLIVVDTRQSASLRFATAFGIVSSLGIVSLGCSPVDRAYFMHFLSMVIWLVPMLYMVIAFFFSATRSQYVSFWFIAASLIMAIGMLFVFMTAQATDLKLIQRMLVICGSIWLVFIIWFLASTGYGAILEWEPSAKEKVDRLSQDYVERISRKKSTREI